MLVSSLNGGKYESMKMEAGIYERHQSEQGVQQEDVQTALCPQNLETPKIYITCLGRDGILTNFLISI